MWSIVLYGKKQYWLVDDIYPRPPIFLQAIPNPVGKAESYFSKCQEEIRKDVERVFGVLQAK